MVRHLWRVCVCSSSVRRAFVPSSRRLARVLGWISQPVGGSEMSRPACVMLLVVLWSGPYLLIHSASRSAATLRQPEQQLPQVQFGGIYRRMLGDNPSTLDPTFLIDAYGRAVVSQVFDGLVQLDAELN